MLAAVFTLLQGAGRWPTFDVLDRYLDGQGVPDGEDLLVGMPQGLLYGVGPHSRPIRDEQEIGLTAAGVAAVDATGEDVALFLALVALAVELESDRPPGGPAPTLDAASAERRLRLPAAGRAELLARAGSVLATEPWGWSGHSPADSDRSWSFTFDRRVRRFRGVAALEDYWNLAHPEPSPPVGLPASIVLPHRSADGEHAWLLLLHPSVAAVAVPRLAAGHADNAVEETWKVVASRLRVLTGHDLDGVDLVNQALGTKGVLELGDRTSAQGRNEHDGITSLLRGLAQVGRNVRAHRPSHAEVAETEVAALLLVASFGLDRLDEIADDDVTGDPVQERSDGDSVLVETVPGTSANDGKAVMPADSTHRSLGTSATTQTSPVIEDP